MAERSYDYTEIKTRIIIRNDSAENWEGSEVILEKGEPAIEYDDVNKTAKIKFGDGVSKFSELPFSTLTPSEVNDLIDSIDAGDAQITTVTTSGDGNAVTGGSISDDGTTLTLTKGTEFVPASGGIFSGDVTVSGDLTVDNIKTSGEISIIPTTNITLSDEPYHDISKITFVNTNKLASEDHISIEAKYRAVMGGDYHAHDFNDLMINHVNVGIDGHLDVKESINVNGLYLTSSEEWKVGEYGQVQVYSLGPHDYGDNAAKIRLLRRQPNPGTYTSQIELNADHVVLSNAPTSDMDAATKKYVDDSVSGIVSAVDAMKFKGTIGTSGTVADIASISSPSTGDTYKIITASTLTSEQSFDSVAHDLTVGDLVVYASNKWVFVPSGNEDVTTVKVAGSGDTINVSTTAQTGALVLGTAAGVNTVSTVTDSATTVPTSSAVKTYVDTLENSLGTAAITDATAYATAAQGTLADNAMPKIGGTFTGDVTVSGELTADIIKSTEFEDTGYIKFERTNPSPGVHVDRLNIYNLANNASIDISAPGITLDGDITACGNINILTTPTNDHHAVTKKYVDDSVSSISTDSLIDGENILILNGGSAIE